METARGKRFQFPVLDKSLERRLASPCREFKSTVQKVPQYFTDLASVSCVQLTIKFYRFKTTSFYLDVFHKGTVLF